MNQLVRDELAIPFVLLGENGNVRLVADATVTVLTAAQARLMAKKLIARADAIEASH